jgi:Arc/MetJ-type ribon-helix-helix transcriptional regulator
MPKRAVRIHPELDQRMQNATKERGYRSPSAFIRAAIETELKSRSESEGMEEQTAASFDRLAKELRRALRGQQAIFALLDAFTKIFLACVPEPPCGCKGPIDQHGGRAPYAPDKNCRPIAGKRHPIRHTGFAGGQE